MKGLASVAITGAFLLALGAASASSTTPAKTHRCPPTSKASTLPKRAGKPMYADVEGDGIRDRITMRTVPHSQCPFFLLVQTRSRDFAVRVPHAYRTLAEGKEPFVAMAVRLGPRGDEVVVKTIQGASTGFVRLYGIARGRLRLLPVGRETDLGFGGTVTHFQGIRCVRGERLTELGMGLLGTRPPFRYAVSGSATDSSAAHSSSSERRAW